MFSCCTCKTSKKEKKDEDDSSEESNDKDVDSSNDVEPIKTQIQSPLKNVKADDTSIKTPIPEESSVVDRSLTSSEVDLVDISHKKMTINEEKTDTDVRENDEDSLSVERVEIAMPERINETIEEEHIYAEVKKRQVPTINEPDNDVENSSVKSQEASAMNNNQKISEDKHNYAVGKIEITITEDTEDNQDKDDEDIIGKDQTEAKDEMKIDSQQEGLVKNEDSNEENLENSKTNDFSSKEIITIEENNENSLLMEKGKKEVVVDKEIKNDYDNENQEKNEIPEISEKVEIELSKLSKKENNEFEENIYEVIREDDSHLNVAEENNINDTSVDMTEKSQEDCQRNLEMSETAENEENDAKNVDSSEVKCHNEQMYFEGNKDEEVAKITKELHQENEEKEEENEDEESSPTISANTIEDAKISAIPFEPGVIGPPKIGLFEAPAYIERTIVDNLDDDGDDSVFERSSGTDDPPSTDVNHEISKDNKQDFELNINQNKIQDVNRENDILEIVQNMSQHIQNIPEQPIYENISQLINIKKFEESECDSMIPERREKPLPRWLSEEDDKDYLEGGSGMQEPPATPVAKDELALRRHRFFSDLLHVAKNSTEHRVRFDPLGPMIHPGCDNDREEQLEQLVTRLENVTKRLESVPTKLFAETQEVAVQTLISSSKKSEEEIQNVIINPEIQQSSPKKVSFENESKTGLGESIMSVAGYEDLIAGPVAEYLQLSLKIGGDVAAHSELVEKAFQIQREFIKTATSRPSPSNQSEQVALLGPTSSQIQLIQEFREKNRGSTFFNHLSAISESIPALGWVAVSPTPAPYVKEMSDAGQFYTNRVLKDWKEKDKTHVEWCKAWVQTLAELQKYVRQHHTTGLVWAKGGSAPIPPPPGGMPPPPPCMPVGDVSGPIGDDRSALFAQINQGENITKSLKKVTSDMQTHKNPSLRTGPAPFKAPVVSNSNSPMKTVAPASAPIDKPPVFTRDGKKWLVEYHKGNKDLLVENAEMNNVVYMYRCQDCTLVIKGKVNSVVMDSCRKSSIVFDSLVSSIEFVNCQSVQMQVLGKVPTISIDKTDGCQMYLSPESLQVELITSKSSEMNVMVPKGNGDYTEYPVPEQFKTLVSPKGLSTTAVDSLG
ncbi:interaptin isoform X1 [Chelonus insularis]|uniref:interaptin isoform X1 n=2 Tax=Chelonus insularis TaxID=460826 RepID=UPI00158AF06A|nr:interaptin isoform X1 [Chelonus insularis]